MLTTCEENISTSLLCWHMMLEKCYVAGSPEGSQCAGQFFGSPAQVPGRLRDKDIYISTLLAVACGLRGVKHWGQHGRTPTWTEAAFISPGIYCVDGELGFDDVKNNNSDDVVYLPSVRCGRVETHPEGTAKTKNAAWNCLTRQRHTHATMLHEDGADIKDIATVRDTAPFRSHQTPTSMLRHNVSAKSRILSSRLYSGQKHPPAHRGSQRETLSVSIGSKSVSASNCYQLRSL